MESEEAVSHWRMEETGALGRPEAFMLYKFRSFANCYLLNVTLSNHVGSAVNGGEDSGEMQRPDISPFEIIDSDSTDV